MEVILLENVRNLAGLGEKVRVKPGFARNYLIPQGKAVYATKENLVKFEQRRAELEKLSAERTQAAQVRQQSLQALAAITIHAKASDEGKLFGSVGVRDIVDAIAKAGVTVEKREVCLPEGALRQIGEYDIEIDLSSDVTAMVKVVVVGEK